METLATQIRSYFAENLDTYLACVQTHLAISFGALLLAGVLGILLAMLCLRGRGTSRWITGVFQVLRIIPSLAVLLLLIPVLGTGTKPALTALVLLGIPPVLLNTVAGFRSVSPTVMETAFALGMTDRQAFWKVRLPLAAPMMLTGIRTAFIEIVASATIASQIGAGGLGDIILTGLGLLRTDLLLVGAVSVAFIALVGEEAFHLLERGLTHEKQRI